VWRVEAEGSWQRSEQRRLGALLRYAWSESTTARSEWRTGVRALGKMADVLAVWVGLGRYCRTGLSPINIHFPIFQLAQAWKYQKLHFLFAKNSKLFQAVYQFKRNNFPYWQIFKFPQDLKLKILEQNKFWIFLEF
jgi:hypothetical protein